MATTAAKRSQTAGGRKCEHCDRPLPANSRAWRRFCSSGCRVRAWDAANRWEGRDESWRDVPLHWHGGAGGRMLVGNGLTSSKVYWRSLGCPPQCRRPLEPGQWSIGCREGHEYAPEIPPEFAGQVSNDNWHAIADPADYGVNVEPRKAAGELVSFAAERRRH